MSVDLCVSVYTCLWTLVCVRECGPMCELVCTSVYLYICVCMNVDLCVCVCVHECGPACVCT